MPDPQSECGLRLGPHPNGPLSVARRNVKDSLPGLFKNVSHDLELGLTWLKQRNFRF